MTAATTESASERIWREHAEALQRSEERAWKLVGRAAPFVNAITCMADDKTPSLAWLADAAIAKDERPDWPKTGMREPE